MAESSTPPQRPPRFQISLLGMMVITFVAAAASAPGYYLFRGGSAGLPESRLVGILMVLAAPLLVMTLLSVLLSFGGHRHDR
jgi:hypothetical protein